MSQDIAPTDRGRSRFWVMAAGLGLLLVVTASREITRPFYGLHSWGLADGPWYARSHVRYGLGYTKGIKTQAMGNPPPEKPERYYDHPQFGTLILALVMRVLGVHVWTQRVLGIGCGLVVLLLMLRLLESLFGHRIASVACLLWILFPITGYFGPGGLVFLTGFLAFWFYLVLIREIPRGPPPKARHLVGLGVVLFLMTQLAWNCYFWAMAIGVHYVFHCLRRRRWPAWSLVAVLVAVPLAGAALAFGIVLVGFDGDFQRIVDLYAWRAAKGEMTGQMKEFDWAAWLARFWEFAVTNFTLPILIVAIVGVAQHVFRRVLIYSGSRNAGRSDTKAGRPRRKAKAQVGLFGGSPHLMLFLMPGVFQVLILRGALWPHQYWERPFGPFIAIAAAMTIVAIWELLGRAHRYAGPVVAGLAMAVLAVPCFSGTNHYFAIRWHHPNRIKLWQDLNRLIPPAKFLLTFDAKMDNLIVTQSKAKGQVIRSEPAWYIDRQIVEAPASEVRGATYRKLSALFMEYVRRMRQAMEDYQAGRMDPQTARAVQQQAERTFQLGIQQTLQADLPVILGELEEKRKSGKYPCYLVPGQLYHPQLGPALAMYLQGLNAELKRRYPTLIALPGQKGERKDGKFFKAGMRPYFVYDLSAPAAGR